MRPVSAALATLALLAAIPTSAQTPALPTAAAVEAVAELGRVTPGASVTVYRDGAIVWSGQFGFANDDSRELVTDRTQFAVYSVAKPWTAAAAARLAQRGALDPQLPVTRYVPEFPDKGDPITSMQLATHTSGIRHYRSPDEAAIAPACTDAVSAIQPFAADPLAFRPGTAKAYSSYGFVLLSAVLERAGQRPFASLMQQEVFGPLGMDATEPATARTRASARSHEWRNGAWAALPLHDLHCKFGAGGFVSTSADLARFYAEIEARPDYLAASFRALLLGTDATGILSVGGSGIAGAAQIIVDRPHRVIVAIAANGLRPGADLGPVARAIASAFAAPPLDAMTRSSANR